MVISRTVGSYRRMRQRGSSGVSLCSPTRRHLPYGKSTSEGPTWTSYLMALQLARSDHGTQSQKPQHMAWSKINKGSIRLKLRLHVKIKLGSMKRQLSQRNNTAKEMMDCLHKFHKTSVMSGINNKKWKIHGIKSNRYINTFHYRHYWEKSFPMWCIYLFVCLPIYFFLCIKGSGFLYFWAVYFAHICILLIIRSEHPVFLAAINQKGITNGKTSSAPLFVPNCIFFNGKDETLDVTPYIL